MNVRRIVMEYLEKWGYGGLCTGNCGCRLSDLMPCDGACDECVPGYEVKTNDPDHYGWKIQEEKP